MRIVVTNESGKDVDMFFYRYHIPDPVYFQRNIRVTIHQIGCWGPDTVKQMRDAGRKLLSIDGTWVDMDKAVSDNACGLFERQDDWSSSLSDLSLRSKSAMLLDKSRFHRDLLWDIEGLWIVKLKRVQEEYARPPSGLFGQEIAVCADGSILS